jgi:glycosyltransferase involved in cell wall biosynthesis
MGRNGLSRERHHEVEERKGGAERVFLTVAVCTHDPDVHLLLRVTNAIRAAAGNHDSTELMLVDNASAVPVHTLPDAVHSGFRVVREDTPGLTAAREAAITASRGEILVFVDDDNIIASDYLHQVARNFSDDLKLGLLGGNVVPEYSRRPPDWALEFEEWLAVRRLESSERVVTTVPPFTSSFPVGAGMAVRTALARDYVNDCVTAGRIEGRRGNALSSGEDIDLAMFVLHSKYSLVSSGDLRLIHVISPHRVELAYLKRLAKGNVVSARAVSAKWLARMGQVVCPTVPDGTVVLCAKLLFATVSGVARPAWRVRRTVYLVEVGERIRSRLGATRQAGN